MKVLHITNNFPTLKYPIFGIFVKEQIDSLYKLGIENEVFLINGREKGRKEYLKSIWKINKIIKSQKFDIIHCHHVYSAIILLFTFRFYNCKLILSYQNPIEKEGGVLLFKLINFFFNAVIIKNNSELTNNKIYYIPNGVNLDFFKEYSYEKSILKLKLNNENKYILFMDSFDRRKQKRIDRFNEVIKILQKDGNPLKIEPLILTNTKRDLIPYYMSISSLHLITSDFEGSPNSVKECLACNVPVVSTPVGNIRHLIGDIDVCGISNSFDPQELADLALSKIKLNKIQIRDNIKIKELDIESVAKKLIEIYVKLINLNK